MFVDNITTGANAVLRSFPFDTGDEIAVTNLGYGGVVNAATYTTRTISGTLRTIELPAARCRARRLHRCNRRRARGRTLGC